MSPRPLRTRAWWVMREMAAFSLTDLLMTVADGSERTAADNLGRYVRSLERHGVLARVRRGTEAWRLARDLGPHAPICRRTNDPVFDPNSGTTLTDKK